MAGQAKRAKRGGRQSASKAFDHLSPPKTPTSTSLPVVFQWHTPLHYSMASEAVQTQLISIQSLNFFPPAEAAASLTSFPILNFLPNSCPICQHPNHPYHRFLLAPLPITISQTIDPLLALYCQLPYRQQASPQHRSFKDFTPLNTTEPIPVIKGLLKIALPLYLLLHHLCERHLKLWQAVCARI